MIRAFVITPPPELRSPEMLDRRQFVRNSATAIAGWSGVLGSLSVARSLFPGSRRSGPLRLGGPVFVKTEDPDELARAHRQLGYRAAYCPKVDLKNSVGILAIASAFSTLDIEIAEVGRWVNLLDPDLARRNSNLK